MKKKNKTKRAFPFGWLSLGGMISLLFSILVIPFFAIFLKSTDNFFVTLWGTVVIAIALLSLIFAILGIITDNGVQKIVSIICLIIFFIVAIFISLLIGLISLILNIA